MTRVNDKDVATVSATLDARRYTGGNSAWWFSSRRLSGIRTASSLLPRQPVSLHSSSMYASALKMQVVVVRNAAGSIVCAWIACACYSLGIVLPARPAWAQRRDELVVVNSVWAIVTFCTVVYLSFLPLMLSLRFLNSPEQRPTVWFCLKKRARSTLVYFVGAVITMFGFGYFSAYLSYVEPSTIKYKLDSYADNLALMGYFTGITRAVKNLLRRNVSGIYSASGKTTACQKSSTRVFSSFFYCRPRTCSAFSSAVLPYS